MKVINLNECGARDPREALRQLLLDIDNGLVIVNLAIVALEADNGVTVRGSGLEMNNCATAIGLLHLGMNHLSKLYDDN